MNFHNSNVLQRFGYELLLVTVRLKCLSTRCLCQDILQNRDEMDLTTKEQHNYAGKNGYFRRNPKFIKNNMKTFSQTLRIVTMPLQLVKKSKKAGNAQTRCPIITSNFKLPVNWFKCMRTLKYRKLEVLQLPHGSNCGLLTYKAEQKNSIVD